MAIGNTLGQNYMDQLGQQRQEYYRQNGGNPSRAWNSQRAGQGAIKGASMGSVAGPWGAAIGGAVGGVLNGFGVGSLGSGDPNNSTMSTDEQKNRQMLLDYYSRASNRMAPQMGPAAQGGLSSFRQNQSDLVRRLEAQSRGKGPSLAAQQLRAATDRLGSQQASIANSGRGGPLAAQNAANNTALLGAQASQDSAAARIAEQQMALNQLGLTLHGARGADEDMSRFNAGQRNQVGQNNLEAKLRTMGMNDDAVTRIMATLSQSSQQQYGRPSMMDQLMAGGAGAFSMWSANKGQQQQGGGTGQIQNTDPFAGWRRNENGSTGPITSPGQLG